MSSHRVFRSLISLTLVVIAIPAIAEDTTSKQSSNDKNTSHLEISAFYGTVQNRFSPRLTPGEDSVDKAAKKDTYSIFGIQFAYPFEGSSGGLEVFGNIRHGKRQSEPNSDAAVDGAGLILSSETVEWHGGFKYYWLLMGADVSGDCPAFYLASQFGFASPSEGPGDMIDDHTYYAVGLELRKGRYKDSYLSVGYGATDIFDQTNARKKIEAGIAFHFSTATDDTTRVSPHSLMLLGLLDSDWGRGSDDLRIVLGYRFSIDEALGRPKRP